MLNELSRSFTHSQSIIVSNNAGRGWKDAPDVAQSNDGYSGAWESHSRKWTFKYTEDWGHEKSYRIGGSYGAVRWSMV